MDWIQQAEELFEYTRDRRRDFHMHPELGFQEIRTAGIVARDLTELGLEVTTGVAETGVVALIEGARPGPTVLLRFDMDALPIEEETGAEYASQNSGVMHACGHDGHTAIGLTVAKMLHARREEMAGRVKLVFQPAEEGLGGAERMVAEGVLESPKVDYSLALHLWNEKPFGWVGVTSGPAMAAAEIFKVRITGKGGHGAAPHLAVDPIAAAAQVTSALQTIVSRNVPPLQTAVVSVTHITAGTTFNVIPPYAEMEGTIRTFEPEVREMVLRRFREIVEGVSAAMGCQAEVDVQRLTPAVINDATLAERIQRVTRSLIPDADLDTTERTMGSEDMAFMMETVPGCYFFIGSANHEAGLDAPHHHPRFDFDERALARGAALMAAAAWEVLHGDGG